MKSEFNKYLKQELSESENKVFEEGWFAEGFKRREERENLLKILAEEGLVPPKPPEKRGFSIFAIIGICLVIGAFAYGLYAWSQRNASPPAPVKTEIYASLDWQGVSLQYLETQLAASFNPSRGKDNPDWQKAYFDRQFAVAIRLLEAKSPHLSDKEKYYLAICRIHLQQFAQTVSELATYDFQNPDFGVDAKWLYALSLLQEDKKEVAKVILKQLQQLPTDSEKATLLLNKL
jgi:hypothetical protein